MDIFKNNIDFNSYKTFYVVAKCKSFSKASEELNISQPAVSIAIKKMEDNLDVTLFKRDKKGIELTETGKQLLFYVESIINTLNTAEKRLKEDKTLTNGEVRIGVPTHIGVFLVSEIIEKFKNIYPGVKFYIESRSTKDMLDMLIKREIDMIIDNSPLGQDISGMKIVPLMSFDNCFVANKKYIKLADSIIDFRELNKYQILLPAERTSTRNILEDVIRSESPNLKLNPVIEVSTTELMYDLVKRGLGIGYFTKSSVINDIVNNDLFEIKTKTKLPKTETCLAYIPEFLGTASSKFIDFMMREIHKKEVREKKCLRIVYTQKCKYNCSFCHREGIKNKIEEKMTTNDIIDLYKFLKNTYNINNVHFTGGEPFLNNNLFDVVEGLKKLGANITITSNGYSINPSDYIFDLIDKINISIHSLDENDYERITTVKGSYKTATDNIKKLKSNYPLLRVEINTTLTKSLVDNPGELEDLIKFAKSIKADLKIIELFPNTDKENFIPIETLVPLLEKMNYKFKSSEFRKTIYDDNENTISLIKCTCSEVSCHSDKKILCRDNNDIYLSMDGNLHLCRFNDDVVSIYNELENNDYIHLKEKVEEYFDRLGNDCIYDKENK